MKTYHRPTCKMLICNRPRNYLPIYPQCFKICKIFEKSLFIREKISAKMVHSSRYISHCFFFFHRLPTYQTSVWCHVGVIGSKSRVYRQLLCLYSYSWPWVSYKNMADEQCNMFSVCTYVLALTCISLQVQLSVQRCFFPSTPSITIKGWWPSLKTIL